MFTQRYRDRSSLPQSMTFRSQRATDESGHDDGARMLDAKAVLRAALLSGAAAIAALLSGCGGGTGPLAVVDYGSHPRPRDYPVHGIDVSKFQGEIDWSKVADSGVKFAWIKASEGGDHADERFQANWEGAKAAGIPHGAYHFVYWCRPPMEEMAFFEQNAPVDPDALPPVLDVEATPTSKTCHRHLTQDGAIADMQVMLNEMERHYGRRPVIYTTVDFYQAILVDGAFSDYPVWVRSTKYHPVVKYGGRAWRFWQYQSDAYIPGIVGKVDRDAFYGTREQWDAFLREPRGQPVETASAPAPTPAQPTQSAAALSPPAVTPAIAQSQPLAPAAYAEAPASAVLPPEPVADPPGSSDQ
jgi:lysozyme